MIPFSSPCIPFLAKAVSYEKTIYHNRYYNFHPHGMRPHASVVFRMDSCCCRSGDWNVGQRGGVSLARRSCHHALERMPLRNEKNSEDLPEAL